MQVKTFEAVSMREAIKAVKNEFGHDAVIVSTNQKKDEHTGVIYEVTAAAASSSKQSGASFADLPRIDTSHIDERLQIMEMKISNLADQTPRKSQIAAIESGLEELKAILMESLQTNAKHPTRNMPKEFSEIYQQLKFMGVESGQLSKLVKYLKDLPKPQQESKTLPEKADDYYKSHAIRWMLKRIKIAEKWLVDRSSTQIHCLIGPSGSGKSSMIAKLAANYKKHHKANILIVSFDNKKLGSSDQMQLYCKILGVPHVTITSANELESAVQKHPQAQLVLVDTAGCSPKNSSQIESLDKLKQTSLPVEFHLVLPISDKASQQDRCIRSFSCLDLSSLAYTKLDESWSYGEIFNLSAKWSVPISFFSIGSRVPEDLERASKERVVERIFGI